MRVTATEAKNRFGHLCAVAKREPVFVEKAGQLDTVTLSAEQYQAPQTNQNKASRSARKKAFEAEFGDWMHWLSEAGLKQRIQAACWL